MEIMASLPLNEEWSMAILFRETEPDYPFIITAWNIPQNISYWDMYFDDPSKMIGKAFHRDTKQEVLIRHLTNYAQMTMLIVRASTSS